MMLGRDRIRRLFDTVAPRYDRANQVLSFGMHHHWRRETVRRSGARPGDHVLDCATGTGDLAFAFRRAVGLGGQVVGLDFSPPMIALARQKSVRNSQPAEFLVGDVLKLPFADRTFDVASVAFGIRNVDDPAAGLREMARVVKPGGCVVVLEFGRPEGQVFGRLFRWYAQVVIPRLGGLITGQPQSYEYLSRSAAAFPSGDEFLRLMESLGVFLTVEMTPLTGRIALIYIGTVA